MDINVTKRLEIDNNQGDFLELKNDDFITIWFKNGTCISAQICGIAENSLIVIDEDDEKLTFYYEEIEDIQEN